MPSSAGVVHEAGVPFRPSISTRHRRQEPKASRLSVAQSLGIGLSMSAAAAITDVPGGTLTLRPSMVSVTVASPVRIGVPVSSSCNSAIADLLFRRRARRRLGEILAEMIERAHDWHGNEPAEGAQRTIRHHLAKIAQQLDVLLAVPAGDDLVDSFDPADRADPARRALAAAFLGAEVEREAGLARHVDSVVEHDDPAMAEHAARGEHRLVVERRVEELFGKIGAERAADLDRADRAPRARAPAEALDQLADREAEGELDQAALADIAGELERLRPPRPADPVVGIGF